jgi:nucleotide-binding universal stress UspA family protein
LARASEAKEIQILIAHEPVPTYMGESNLHNTINTQLDQSQEIVHRAEDAVGKVPAMIYSELMEGQITETILNMAKTRRSDLIIIGAQGLGRLAGALLGINGQRIVSEAPCPVLIVK